ncbi:MAG: hypothetical protein V1910_00485 [bacterium]
MAKKTRKEKMIAQYRRRLQLLETKPDNKILPTIVDKPVETKQVISQSIDLSEDDQMTKKYFISDFKKSLIIIVTIITLEIGLYFATMLINKF